MKFFDKLFGTKKMEAGQPITLNLHEGGFDVDSFHPMRYYWDYFGIEASTYDHETLHNIVIFLGKSKHPLPMTECAFSGTLLFDGQPWQEIVLKEGYGGVDAKDKGSR